MSQTLTVVVPTHDPGSSLSTVVSGLDAQTLGTDAFSVVIADAGSTDGSLPRWERLAGSRPNVTLLTDADLAAGVAAAPGAYVLVVEPHTRLLPEALARLAAAAGDVDVVVGRRRLGTHRAAGPLRPPADPAALRAPLDPTIVAASVDGALLVRRELLTESLAADPDRWAAACLERATSIGLVTDYACLLTPSDTGSRPGLRPRPATLHWSGAVLHLDVTAAVVPGTDIDQGVVLVLGGSDGIEYVLDTVCVPTGTGAGATTLTASATLDLDDAALAGLDGRYRARLRLGGLDGGIVELPIAGPLPALLDGRAVVVRPVRQAAEIDVGAQGSSLLTTLSVTAGSVEESARGSLLRVPVPDLYVHGTEPLAGTVALGGLWLPARIAVEETPDGLGGVLECYVSGLEGRSTVGLRFGRGAIVPSGCDLVMSHLGHFTVEPTPAPAPAAAGKPAAETATTGAPAPRQAAPKAAPKATRRPVSRLRRLRRAVPAPLEPVARAVSGFGPARSLYRRLARR